MQNVLHTLHDEHPRVWCAVTVVPMFLVTVVMGPLVFLWEVLVIGTIDIAKTVWSELGYHFWSNLRCFHESVSMAWHAWLATRCGESGTTARERRKKQEEEDLRCL